MTFDCRGLVGGDFPELGESAKVIQADKVAGLGGPAQALHPPFVTAGANGVPVVERIAPALTGGAEIVGRNAGDNFGQEVFLPQAK